MSILVLLLLALALAGHLAFWVMLFNRLHALPLPCRAINAIEKLLMAAAIVIPLLAVWMVAGRAGPPPRWLAWETWFALRGTGSGLSLVAGYLWFSLGVVAIKVPRWLMIRGGRLDGGRLRRTEGRVIDAAQVLPGPLTAATWKGRAARLPGNQSLQLEVNQKRLEVPRLPQLLNGLTIGHVSDLHFTGAIAADYYRLVIEQLKQLECDLVVLTGDVIDKPECLPWIEEVLGELQMPGRSFSILGNHDKRVGSAEEVRAALQRAGWIDLGGRATMIDLRKVRLLLAGNERPWYPDVPPPSPRTGPGSNLFRILLSHSPDEFPWAVEQQYDLVLAGHTHGGQIRFPLWGPMVVPSRFGVRYASGTFSQDQTVMHVSRGISGLQPLRWNCRPELTRLELVSGPE